MKISTKLFNEQQIRQFSSLNEDIQKLQDRISSGKNIVVASDDPVGSVNLSGYKTVKQQLDQYLKNVNSAQTRLSLVDTNLQNLSTIMIRANELLIQASSDVLGRSDREAIALEIDEMKEELLSLANQQDANGSFIFGGFKTKTQPFQENLDGKIEYKGDAGTTSLSVSETMVVQTSVDGESLFQKIKGSSGVTVSMFTMLENISNSVRTASSAVHATKADTHAEFEITNSDYGTWSFDITGHGGTANISVELTGDDPADIIKAINNANIGITASQSSTNPKKIKLDSSQQGEIEIKNLEIPNIKTAQKVPTSFITFDPLDASGNKIGHSQTLYDNDQLTSAQLNNIADTQVHIANFRGEVGAKLNLLVRQNENLTERDIAIKKDLSDLEDADLAALVTDLKAQLTGLQASQQAFVKISNLNLFNYIK
jgi:flagellar hook-associated protein 3 FlgL